MDLFLIFIWAVVITSVMIHGYYFARNKALLDAMRSTVIRRNVAEARAKAATTSTIPPPVSELDNGAWTRMYLLVDTANKYLGGGGDDPRELARLLAHMTEAAAVVVNLHILEASIEDEPS